jgi:hypothetical protein
VATSIARQPIKRDLYEEMDEDLTESFKGAEDGWVRGGQQTIQGRAATPHGGRDGAGGGAGSRWGGRAAPERWFIDLSPSPKNRGEGTIESTLPRKPENDPRSPMAHGQRHKTE